MTLTCPFCGLATPAGVKACFHGKEVPTFAVGESVRVHAFGHFYPGVVVKVTRKRVTVRYTSGTGVTRDKAVGADSGMVRKVEATEHATMTAAAFPKGF